MVENEDAVRLQRRLQESFHSGIVTPLHLLVVVEILDDGGVPGQRKTFAVEREVSGNQARIEIGTLCGSGSAVDLGSPGSGSKA